tara:strand:- start:2317 stop:2460 length:144 start_codon:yes stop_codon:yes gene_type:complete
MVEFLLLMGIRQELTLILKEITQEMMRFGLLAKNFSNTILIAYMRLR